MVEKNYTFTRGDNERMTRQEIIEALRALQRQVRMLTVHSEYLRGMYDGVEMTLAVLENGGFKPMLRPSLNEPDVVEEALRIINGGPRQ